MRRLVESAKVSGSMRLVLSLVFSCFLFCAAVMASEEYVKPRLAVVPFATKSVDEATVQAVTELVQSRLENSNLYIMVERTQVERVFKEQVFQYSGSVDEATAIKAGKMLGASKLVLGSINKLEKSYVITGRIVDVETGEIEISDTETSNSIFDSRNAVEDMVKILVLKDRTSFQSSLTMLAHRKGLIGLYLAGFGSNISIPTFSRSFSQGEYLPSFTAPYSFDIRTHAVTVPPLSLGMGLRYFFQDRYFVDVAYAPQAAARTAGFDVHFIGAFDVTNHPTFDITQGPVLSCSLGRIFPVSKRVNFQLSAGILSSFYKLDSYTAMYGYSQNEGSSYAHYYLDSSKDGQEYKEERSYFLFPVVAAFEWRVQQRVGITLSASYFIGSLPSSKFYLDGYLNETWDSNGNRISAESDRIPIDVFKPELKPSINLVTTFYFG